MTRHCLHRLPLVALALALFVSVLAGCWVPEHYLGRIRIKRDGSYVVSLEGTAVHPEALRAMRRLDAAGKGGALKPEELQKRQAEALAPLQKDLDALKGESSIQTVKSVGDGRVRFILLGEWRIETDRIVSMELREPLAYAVGQDGSLSVRVKDALPGWEGRELGVAVDGDLSIVLDEGIQVLESNAQQKPTTPRGAYHWHIDGATTQAPYLKLRLPSAEPAPEPRSSQVQKKLAHH
ncbi:MAG: hypothetical protein P4L39_02850 [Humidesulfovibrio sp.]|nr:hypothetical protein [Humidesulfovibrio sp.]